MGKKGKKQAAATSSFDAFMDLQAIDFVNGIRALSPDGPLVEVDDTVRNTIFGLMQDMPILWLNCLPLGYIVVPKDRIVDEVGEDVASDLEHAGLAAVLKQASL